MKSHMHCLAAGLTLAFAATAWAVDERTSNQAEQTALAVTIYNSDLALVKDSRRVKLVNGENLLAWRDVSARIQPETGLLTSLDGKPLTLLEQNFDFDLLTPQKLLEKYVGQVVRVIKTLPMTGTESVEAATVLAANGGVVLKYIVDGRVETGLAPNARIAYGVVPPNLRDRPTLTMDFVTDQAGERDLELSYLSGGLSWKADYVAELSGDDKTLDLNGWVTLTNQSGSAYNNARLQLVAGDVNRVRPEMKRMVMARAAPAMAEAAADMSEESLFEYHLYTLGRPTSIQDQQTKQVALLSAQKVPVAKEYQLRGAEYYYSGQYGDLGRKLKAGVFMEFDNKADGRGSGLGLPLPKGVVRVYKKDSAGRAQFIGEDRIDHTAKGERLRLKLGDAFDISADKKQTDFQKIAAFGRGGGVIETAYQIEIRNAKKEDVVVKVIEPMPGDWQMVAESLPHRKDTAQTAAWDVPVPAEGKSVLTWRARIRY
ncbi:MAG TPA: DUF4139 domain-containing protein [Thiobacillaceae bacterium]|nr:DUF4139 domain-containing protein [Thiobacillaceae bacterium]